MVVIVVLAATIARLDRTPFEDGLRGSCGAFFAVMAHNHVAHGLAATWGIPVLNPGAATRAQFVYYRHHPPLIPLLLAAVFRVTGESESAARGLALAFHMLTLYLLAVVLWPACGSWLTLAAVGAAAAMPYSTYYGPFMNFEVPCLTLLVTTAMLIAVGDARTARWGLLSYVCGGLLDWPIFLAAPFFAWRVRRTSRTLAVLYLGLPVVAGAVVYAWQIAQVMRGGSFPDAGGLASYIHDASPLADNPGTTVLPSLGLTGWAWRRARIRVAPGQRASGAGRASRCRGSCAAPPPARPGSHVRSSPWAC
ncbi:MAG: glycosyltransferase family 39 protein [Planctomycetota bacterium]